MGIPTTVIQQSNPEQNQLKAENNPPNNNQKKLPKIDIIPAFSFYTSS